MLGHFGRRIADVDLAADDFPVRAYDFGLLSLPIDNDTGLGRRQGLNHGTVPRTAQAVAVIERGPSGAPDK